MSLFFLKTIQVSSTECNFNQKSSLCFSSSNWWPHGRCCSPYI